MSKLVGKTVLTTRAQQQASQLADLLTAAGAQALNFPCIEFVPTQVDLPQSMPTEKTQWLLCTSAVGAYFANERGLCAERRIAAIGEKTAESLRLLGFEVDFVSPVASSEGFAKSFLEFLGADSDSIFAVLARGASASEVLSARLGDAGVAFESVTLYKTRFPGDGSVRLAELRACYESIDFLSFTSSEIAKNFTALAQGDEAIFGRLSRLPLVVIGEATAKTARELGYQEVTVAKESSVEGIVATLALL